MLGLNQFQADERLSAFFYTVPLDHRLMGTEGTVCSIVKRRLTKSLVIVERMNRDARGDSMVDAN